MEDKRTKSQFIAEEQLTFTKEDRNAVFDQINKMEHHTVRKASTSITKRISIVTASFIVVGLCIFLFNPSLLQENVHNEHFGTETSRIVAESQEEEYVTTLLSVKDEYNRVPLNLLLSYNKENEMMKVVSIPRDTYAPIKEKNGTTSYDKLTFAYEGGGAENVKATVSKLLNVSIDYYGVMDLETFSELIELVDGVEYELDEDIQVRAISQVAFEFKKGTHRFNGEEVVTLMMDATEGRNLDEADQVNLMLAVIDQTVNVLPQAELEQLAANLEGNIPMGSLFEDKVDLHFIQSVSLMDGMMNTMIDESYFIQFEQDFLNSISEQLTTFN